MALSPWLSSIASWKKPSSSRFKVSPIVHTAPEKENRRRKRSRSLSLDRLQGPHLNLDTTERNHDTGPHSAAKVDHFFAAADTVSIVARPAPDNRSGHVHVLDAREGGIFRIPL